VSGVLVGFDESAAAGRALDRGIEEARARHTRLVVLSVFEVPLRTAQSPGEAAGETFGLEEAA
jgi:nucleotide-binding universal stress UspA family protein